MSTLRQPSCGRCGPAGSTGTAVPTPDPLDRPAYRFWRGRARIVVAAMRNPIRPAVRTMTLGLVALATVVAPRALGTERPPAPVQAVPAVDLDRYAGLWYEIARLPNRFQNDCACCVTATYTRREGGRLTVVNGCRTADGKSKAVEGEAKLATEGGPTSTLKVRFAPRFLSFIGAVWGDYWVLDLPEDYSHALVGSPDRKYLWVLSRESTMTEETYAGVLDEGREHGLRRHPHPEDRAGGLTGGPRRSSLRLRPSRRHREGGGLMGSWPVPATALVATLGDDDPRVGGEPGQARRQHHRRVLGSRLRGRGLDLLPRGRGPRPPRVSWSSAS